MDTVKGGIESIAIGTDERTALVDSILRYLDERGFRYTLHEVAPWPEIAEKVGRSVALGDNDEGILLCWTGTGVSLAANKIPGVRAALCSDAAVATGARKWNHANVLALGLGFTTPEKAREILDAWFSAPFDEGETANVTRVVEMERHNRP
ncbi:MAG: RpiB/LacA/LacB family sugar-phosphate isomerase [Chloroflexi bacterium]|nr:RpiB/LacA/LacB family sugar-phosphate isomerase [Chloroflexota bacterium]